jgi:hypothetical protein
VGCLEVEARMGRGTSSGSFIPSGGASVNGSDGSQCWVLLIEIIVVTRM